MNGSTPSADGPGIIDLDALTNLGTEIEAFLVDADPAILAYWKEDAERAERPRVHLPIMAGNPFFDAWDACRTGLAVLLEDRSILAFHYTRLTDIEVDRVRAGGFEPTSLDLLRRRLDGQVEEGNLTADMAAAIYASSPLNFGDGYGKRDGLFWTVAPARSTKDGGVTPLLKSWGGEVAYWCLDVEQIHAVQAIGRGRVFSIALDLSQVEYGPSCVAGHILAFRASQMGFNAQSAGSDFYVETPIGPDRILEVVSEGEKAYGALGRG